MLTRAIIRNYCGLREVDTELKPVTVLIGPNDSGKSTFLKALALPFSAQQPTLHIDSLSHWKGTPSYAVSLTLERASGGEPFVVQRPDRRGDVVTYERKPYPPGLRAWLIELPAFGPAMQSPGVPEHVGIPELDPQAGNFPALLDLLLRLHRQRFNELERAACQQIPGLEQISVATPDPNTRRIDFRFQSDFVLPAARASVGARLILFFLTLAYHPKPPDLLLVEEPENGVHPKRLADILKLLRGIAKGEHCGHPAQVILSTHSPYLLDHVNLDEDQVLVFQRESDGARNCHPIDRAGLKDFLDDFMLGEVWFNEGEERLVQRGS